MKACGIGAHTQALGLGFGGLDQFGNIGDFGLGVADKNHHAPGQAGDGLEVFHGVVGQVFDHNGVDRQMGVGAQEQGVAVGRGLLDRHGRDDAVAARAVFNHHTHTQRSRDLLTKVTRGHVRATARCGGHHDAQSPRRKGALRQCLCRPGQAQAQP